MFAAKSIIFVIFGLIISVLVIAAILFVLYLIIKTAVRNGFDESRLSKMLISQQNKQAPESQNTSEPKV